MRFRLYLFDFDMFAYEVLRSLLVLCTQGSKRTPRLTLVLENETKRELCRGTCTVVFQCLEISFVPILPTGYSSKLSCGPRAESTDIRTETAEVETGGLWRLDDTLISGQFISSQGRRVNLTWYGIVERLGEKASERVSEQETERKRETDVERKKRKKKANSHQ